MHRIRGHVAVSEPLAWGAELIVTLEEASRADTPSIVIAQHRRPLELSDELQFTLSCPEVLPPKRYVVRALIDFDGDGEAGAGDYESFESHPVRVDGDTEELTIPVRVLR